MSHSPSPEPKQPPTPNEFPSPTHSMLDVFLPFMVSGRQESRSGHSLANLTPATLSTHLFVLFFCVTCLLPARALDLRDAVIVCAPDASPRQKQAVKMLVEEAEKRTRIHWPQLTAWPATNVPVIAVGLKSAAAEIAGQYAEGLQSPPPPGAAEGYRLCVRKTEKNPAVIVLGDDERGVLFGVGNLLRELRMERGNVSLRDDVDFTTAPKYPLRGHQLGYRPKCNSYDAWDLPTWEQYFRDLAVFGCNAVELIPPRSDDDANSPHFPRPPLEMMQGMSRLADAYGLDVWIWYPAMDKDYSDARTVEFALREWGEVFGKLSRVTSHNEDARTYRMYRSPNRFQDKTPCARPG